MNRTSLNQAFRSVLPILILALLFLFSAYVAQTYEDYFAEIMSSRGVLGIFVYIFISAATTVVAPLSSVPLMPLASNIWGPVSTALASVLGWWIGAIVSFYISRKYGRVLVEKIFSKEKLDVIEKKVPEKNIFWSIVLLRMVVPVDLLSYVLGLFKPISWKVYIWATLVGTIPFAFVFAYLGTLPWHFQLIGVVLIILLLLILKRKK